MVNPGHCNRNLADWMITTFERDVDGLPTLNGLHDLFFLDNDVYVFVRLLFLRFGFGLFLMNVNFLRVMVVNMFYSVRNLDYHSFPETFNQKNLMVSESEENFKISPRFTKSNTNFGSQILD